MRRPRVRLALVAVLLCSVLAACAAPPAGQRSESTGGAPARTGPKRLVTVIMAEPATLYRALFRGGVTQALDVSDFLKIDELEVRGPSDHDETIMLVGKPAAC